MFYSKELTVVKTVYYEEWAGEAVTIKEGKLSPDELESLILDGMLECRICAVFEGFPNYAVSATGTVYNIKYHRKIHKEVCHNGYHRVVMYAKGSKRTWFRVSTLVATAFRERPGKEYEVDHLNWIKTDDYWRNLIWATTKDNRRRKKKFIEEILKRPHELLNELYQEIIKDGFENDNKELKEWINTRVYPSMK